MRAGAPAAGRGAPAGAFALPPPLPPASAPPARRPSRRRPDSPLTRPPGPRPPASAPPAPARPAARPGPARAPPRAPLPRGAGCQRCGAPRTPRASRPAVGAPLTARRLRNGPRRARARSRAGSVAVWRWPPRPPPPASHPPRRRLPLGTPGGGPRAVDAGAADAGPRPLGAHGAAPEGAAGCRTPLHPHPHPGSPRAPPRSGPQGAGRALLTPVGGAPGAAERGVFGVRTLHAARGPLSRRRRPVRGAGRPRGEGPRVWGGPGRLLVCCGRDCSLSTQPRGVAAPFCQENPTKKLDQN